MAGKEPDTGPTAQTVAGNVERLRKAQGLNYTQLSEQLQSRAKWSINAVGIRRIESGERRVTVDDLMALAVALGVSPATLLYPDTADAGAAVVVTGLPNPSHARVVWEWVSATMWAYWAVENTGGFTTPSDFFRRAWPKWLVDDLDVSPEPGVGSGLDGYDFIWNQAREKARAEQLKQDSGVVPNGDD